MQSGARIVRFFDPKIKSWCTAWKLIEMPDSASSVTRFNLIRKDGRRQFQMLGHPRNGAITRPFGSRYGVKRRCLGS